MWRSFFVKTKQNKTKNAPSIRRGCVAVALSRLQVQSSSLDSTVCVLGADMHQGRTITTNNNNKKVGGSSRISSTAESAALEATKVACPRWPQYSHDGCFLKSVYFIKIFRYLLLKPWRQPRRASVCFHETSKSLGRKTKTISCSLSPLSLAVASSVQQHHRTRIHTHDLTSMWWKCSSR